MPRTKDDEKSSDPTPFGVRIPSELRAWIKAQAKSSRRSMNTEIVWMLEQFKNQQENHD